MGDFNKTIVLFYKNMKCFAFPENELYAQSLNCIYSYMIELSLSPPENDLVYNLLIQMDNRTINYIESWNLINNKNFKDLLVHLILFNSCPNHYDKYHILSKVNFKPNDLQRKIMIQKSLNNIDGYKLFLFKNLPILTDVKDNIINSYIYISCPLLKLV